MNGIETVASNAGLQVLDIGDITNKDTSFLNVLWTSIILLPSFSLITASLSLVGYISLSINEQRQEFGILRALGAKPTSVLGMVSVQSLFVLLGSYAVGVAFGIIATLLVLVQQPVVSTFTILEIAGGLLLAFAITMVSSIYPAVRFANKPLLETITQL
jgi:putative ABC transport system permease protein